MRSRTLSQIRTPAQWEAYRDQKVAWLWAQAGMTQAQVSQAMIDDFMATPLGQASVALTVEARRRGVIGNGEVYLPSLAGGGDPSARLTTSPDY